MTEQLGYDCAKCLVVTSYMDDYHDNSLSNARAANVRA
jgi:hypothetical protein